MRKLLLLALLYRKRERPRASPLARGGSRIQIQVVWPQFILWKMPPYLLRVATLHHCQGELKCMLLDPTPDWTNENLPFHKLAGYLCASWSLGDARLHFTLFLKGSSKQPKVLPSNSRCTGWGRWNRPQIRKGFQKWQTWVASQDAVSGLAPRLTEWESCGWNLGNLHLTWWFRCSLKSGTTIPPSKVQGKNQSRTPPSFLLFLWPQSWGPERNISNRLNNWQSDNEELNLAPLCALI